MQYPFFLRPRNVGVSLGRHSIGRRRTCGPLVGLISSAVWACCAGSALAQALPPSQATVQEGLRREQARATQLAKPNAPPDALAPAVTGNGAATPRLSPALLSTPEDCFFVHRLQLQGDGADRFRWLQDQMQSLSGYCVGVQGLQRITQVLNQTLIDQGYVTSRVSLPQQNIAQGTVQWQLHLGRVEAVRQVVAAADAGPGVVAGSPDTRWGAWQGAMPVSAGDALNIRDIEQGIEQMKRLPSQDVTTRIEPGTQPDTSVLIIERTLGPAQAQAQRRLRGSASLDNGGSKALGRWQAAFNLALDQWWGVHDIVNLSLSTNAQDPNPAHRSQSGQLGYSVPWGYNLFSASASHARFAQRIALTTTQVLNQGSSDTRSLKWQHTALRAASWKATLDAELSERSSRSYIDDSENLVAHRHTTQFTVTGGWRHLLNDSDTLEASVGYQRGVPWLHAEPELPDLPGVPRLRAGIWRANWQADIALPSWGAGWRMSSQVRAQRSAQATLSMDQLALGGAGSVRGFDGDTVLVAERGWVWRQEWSRALKLGVAGSGSVYLGLDAGRVWGPSGGQLLGHALAGAALGLRASHGAWSLDAALGAPLFKPEGFKTAPLHLSVHASRAL